MLVAIAEVLRHCWRKTNPVNYVIFATWPYTVIDLPQLDDCKSPPTRLDVVWNTTKSISSQVNSSSLLIEKRKKKERIVLREIHLRTMGRHLSNGITQCYLLPDRGGRPAFTPTGQVGTQFIDPARMKGWVGLVGWLHTEMVYPSTDSHPSAY